LLSVFSLEAGAGLLSSAVSSAAFVDAVPICCRWWGCGSMVVFSLEAGAGLLSVFSLKAGAGLLSSAVSSTAFVDAVVGSITELPAG